MRIRHALFMSVAMVVSVVYIGALPAVAMAQAGPAEADIPGLMVQLGSQDQVEAARAVTSLAGLGPKAVPYLLDALKNGVNVDGVLGVLWEVRDERAIRPVAEYINSGYQDRAKGVLRAYGNMAVPVLAGLLKDPSYRDAAIDVLKDIVPSEESLKSVRPLLGGVAAERGGAALVLGWWKDKGYAGMVEGLLKDADPDVRRYALDGYGMMYSDSPERFNQSILMDILKNDPFPDIRQRAVLLLGQHPTENIVGTIIEVMKKEKDKMVLHAVLHTAGVTKDPRVALPLLEALEKQDDQRLKAVAIWSLGNVKSEEAVPYILDTLKQKVELDELLDTSFDALANIGKPVDVRPYLKYLAIDDRHGSTKRLLNLIKAYALPGDDETIKALEHYKATSVNEDLAEEAGMILEKIK